MALSLAVLCRCCAADDPSSPQPPGPPWASWDRGLSSTNRLWADGKVDILYKNRSSDDQYNVFGWSPLFKGGLGRVVPSGGLPTDYAGGYVRPLAGSTGLGDLILGGLDVRTGPRHDWEFQGEYRFPFGLGFGGGTVESIPGAEIHFAKLTYRGVFEGWNYVGEIQVQEFAQHTSLGGYGAVYDENWMWVQGTDGEQWRTSVGYLGPKSWTVLRPAAEVTYVDNTPGRVTGPRSLFANLTLMYSGGFLSHAARLGRGMGPQGLEYGNPLGFLAPTWNRRLEVWEMGGLADFRADRVRAPNGAVTERYEGLLFPGQWDDRTGILGHLFLGGSYSHNPLRSTPGVLGGFAGRIGFLMVSAGVDYEIHPARRTFTLGLIDRF